MRFVVKASAVIGFASVAIAGLVCASPGRAQTPVAVDQGPLWTSATRTAFYSQDQGSQIMPLLWFEALKQPNGEPFLGASLSRYGYLPNPASPTPGLPVGFTVNVAGQSIMVGMTCAACHTRQIVSQGTAYRIDGGPAIVDFQAFLVDMDTAVATVLNDSAAFGAFATSVLGPSPTPAQQASLRSAVAAWFLRYDTLVQRALPTPAWGPARLDAVAMIFNRLTGLDLGEAPSYLIADNIQKAVAPVRYPFLWNAARQDYTQWPGFAPNGDALLGLARNLGEVYGVFATFEPQSRWFGIDYLEVNSADFKGLFALEGLMKQIGPPQWPWEVNNTLADQGKIVFDRSTADGGCVTCHGIRPGTMRFPDQPTWATPIMDVGTDRREYDVMAWTANSGVLNGAHSVLDPTPLKPVDRAFKILGMAVIGSISSYCVLNPVTCAVGSTSPALAARTSMPDEFSGLYTLPTPSAAYESRVLQGVWAAAPYLHNGSVPTLAELLTPAAQRVKSFPVGPDYDQVKIGLAATQSTFNYTFQATGCDQLDSGNSNCGHEYGTNLSPGDKAALLEYLKAL